MELARANASSGQVAKRQGSGTNNILWKGAPTSSADWQRKQGGQRCSACWKASSRTKAGTKLGRKSRFEKQKWSLFFLGVFFWIFFFFPSLPTCPMINSIPTTLLFWGGPSDKRTFAYCLGLCYFSTKTREPRGGNRFEQVTKQNTETTKAT